MIEDYLHGPDHHRSVENPGESSSDGGGHRFLFYGSPGGEKKGEAAKKKPEIGAPVKLELTGDSLADDIVEVHNEKTVHDKVEELGDKIQDLEGDVADKEKEGDH